MVNGDDKKRSKIKVVGEILQTRRYEIAYKEISSGGPGGYESTYLTKEGDPASDELYQILDSLNGKLLPSDNISIRNRNGLQLINSLKENKLLGLASGFKPSGAYHFGHSLVASTVAFFQKNGVQVFMPIADVETYMDTKMTKDDYMHWTADNLLDWGASGVNLDAAHIYLQSEEKRVSDLAYLVARGLTFDLPVDIYGMKKMIDDFPFLFAGISQVGDILLAQHKDFGNYHSFMVSGQDQDGHMKMTVELTKKVIDNKINFIGVKNIPSAFYIPHIRGIGGKASSSKPETTIFLGSGPDKNNKEDLEQRIKSSLKKIDDDNSAVLTCLDMVRYINVFNQYSKLNFRDIIQNMPELVQQEMDKQVIKENEPTTIDLYLLEECKKIGQNNVQIVREFLPEALKQHQNLRKEILDYAITKSNYKGPQAWEFDDKPEEPSFWKVPEKARVNHSLRNSTQWFNIVYEMKDKIAP